MRYAFCRDLYYRRKMFEKFFDHLVMAFEFHCDIIAEKSRMLDG